MREVLVITCDAPPLPPENGHNLKTIQVMRALRSRFELHCLVYGEHQALTPAFTAAWGPPSEGCHLTVLTPRPGAGWRSWTQGLTRSTTRRDFTAEEREIRRIAAGGAPTRVLADYITGAPIAPRLPGGLVVSGHDCMSLLLREEARLAADWKGRWMRRITARRLERAERNYLHLAGAVHVVSQQDAGALARINPRARVEVIPLASEAPPETALAAGPSRSRPVFWFHAELPHHRVGVAALLASQPPEFWRSVLLLGRVPFDVACRSIPGLAPFREQYLPYATDLQSTLAQADWVLLPDVTGTGQKNRALTAMAHGACVIGFAESFRDLPGRHGVEFLELGQAGEFPSVLQRWTPSLRAELGRAARAMILRHYSLAACGERWNQLLDRISPLPA